jgi:tRNA pseudouridine38-40 synthase
MVRYKVTCAFNGYHYFGWQIQPQQPTIQACVEKALSTIAKSKISVIGCSRTDARVSALGFVFHFDSPIQIPQEGFKQAFNSNLPSDIRVFLVEVVSSDFHARYDVLKKRYLFTIETGAFNVFEYQHVMQYNRPLDVESMQLAANYLVGTHDFTSYNATPLVIAESQVRTIDRLTVLKEDSKIKIIVESKSFLHHMVRMIVQTLIEVGAHRISIEQVERIKQAKDKRACPYNAPAEGLTLERVWYKE